MLFNEGEFQMRKMWHEGLNEGLDETGEPMIGPDTSITTFTRSFRNLQSRLLQGPQHDGERLITIDGGPHTFWWPTQSPDGEFSQWDVPAQQLLREIQPDAKFILTLSDPTKRMYSDYYFLEDNLRPVRPGGASSKSAEQFHERVREQIETFNFCVSQYMQDLKLQTENRNWTFAPSEYAASVKNILPQDYYEAFPLWFRSAQMYAFHYCPFFF